MDTQKIKSLIIYKLQISPGAFLVIFPVIIGILAGFGAIIFRWLINYFNLIFFVKTAGILSFLGPYYVIIIPSIGGLIIGPIIHFFARETKGHGVPEVMLSVAKYQGKIRLRVAFIKSLVSSICIGSGGSVGREGPIVQIGSSLGSGIGQLFSLPEDKIKILVGCGAAAGIAATFNAPLAAIFFSLEVILRQYGPRHISSIVISAVTATVVSRHFLGDHPAFILPEYHMISYWEIFLYFFLGIISAIIALLYTRTIYLSEDIFDNIRVPEYIKPFFGGLLVGAIGFFYPEIFGVGYKAIEKALEGNIEMKTAFIIGLLKILATSLTIGSGGSGGVFAPSLFIGAMLGNFYAHVIQKVIPSIPIPVEAYSLVGMGAVFAGAAHAPISAILILFEMSGDYKIIIPLMISTTISTIVATHISRDSIYTLKLKRNGIDITNIRSLDLIDTIKVSEAMIRDVIYVYEDDTIKQAGLKIKHTRHRGFPVLDKRGCLCGIITHRDINKALSEGKSSEPVKKFMTHDIAVCYPSDSLRIAIKKMGRINVGRLPVVEPMAPEKLVGLITRKSIIQAYHKAIKDIEQNNISEK